MSHHVAHLPPVIIPQTYTTEKPRWRPRVRLPNGELDDPEALSEGGEAYAAEAAQEDEHAARAKRAKRAAAKSATPFQVSLTGATLADETLRILLAVQEAAGE